jgi:hypothetical protein
MHYRQVTFQRDETTSMPTLVGDWEVPILEAKHGEERLTVGELKAFENRPWPEDAKSEMQRLNMAYGNAISGDNPQTWAERVYGVGSQGVRNLESAIAAARAAAEGPAPKRGRPRKAEADPDLIGDAASA